MLRDRRFNWAEAESRCRGMKLHLAYDPRAAATVHFAVETPKLSEIKVARRQPFVAGATHAFDKGYTDYRWWHEITMAGAPFVTRLKSNARRRVERTVEAIDDTIVADRRVKIGHKNLRGGAKAFKVRLKVALIPISVRLSHRRHCARVWSAFPQPSSSACQGPGRRPALVLPNPMDRMPQPSYTCADKGE